MKNLKWKTQEFQQQANSECLFLSEAHSNSLTVFNILEREMFSFKLDFTSQEVRVFAISTVHSILQEESKSSEMSAHNSRELLLLEILAGSSFSPQQICESAAGTIFNSELYSWVEEDLNVQGIGLT